MTELSEYELQRLANIARNRKVLESLGLVSSDAEMHHQIRDGKGGEPKAKRQKAAVPGSAEEARAALRRSQRLAGLPASGDDDDAPVF